MNDKHIEASLERSLREQVGARQLDAGFNAAVWARIAAQEAPAPARVLPAASRWLMASNILGAAVSVALILYFGVSHLTSVDVGMDISLPQISPQTNAAITTGLTWAITAGALVMGMAFTPLGRRLRNLVS